MKKFKKITSVKDIIALNIDDKLYERAVCPICKQHFIVELTPEEFDVINNPNMLVQDLIPFGWDEDDREMLMSGMCDECWDKFMGGYETT